MDRKLSKLNKRRIQALYLVLHVLNEYPKTLSIQEVMNDVMNKLIKTSEGEPNVN